MKRRKPGTGKNLTHAWRVDLMPPEWRPIFTRALRFPRLRMFHGAVTFATVVCDADPDDSEVAA